MDLLKPFSQKHTNRSYGLTICVLRSGTGWARLGGWSVGLSSWDWYLLLTLGPSNCPVKHYPFPPPGPLSPFWGKKEKKNSFHFSAKSISGFYSKLSIELNASVFSAFLPQKRSLWTTGGELVVLLRQIPAWDLGCFSHFLIYCHKEARAT